MRFKPKQGQVVAEVINQIDGAVEVEELDKAVKVSGKFVEGNVLRIPAGKGAVLVGGGGKVTPA